MWIPVWVWVGVCLICGGMVTPVHWMWYVQKIHLIGMVMCVGKCLDHLTYHSQWVVVGTIWKAPRGGLHFVLQLQGSKEIYSILATLGTFGLSKSKVIPSRSFGAIE